jgi:hypothetical protein
MKTIAGPQGEPLLSDEELRALSDSSVASGTDRDIDTERAVLVGPQGEKIYPTADGICPVCGQSFPEECSRPSGEPDGFDDSDNEPVDDRDDMVALSA